MEKSAGRSTAADVVISLNAVLFAISANEPCVLCVQNRNSAASLPYGPFDPNRHRTFEIGAREWVARQTEIQLGHVEQLYTFGDKDRDDISKSGRRHISVGYLALAAEPSPVQSTKARWVNWYSLFPWEDLRDGPSTALADHIIPGLFHWAGASRDAALAQSRRQRIGVAFGHQGNAWEEALVLERYELMYEAKLVPEALHQNLDQSDAQNMDPALGRPMIADHRRILATAIGRLRGKLRYRPVLFEMTPQSFTLLQLQTITEAIVGFQFHKQNFRRTIEKSGFVKRTSEAAQTTSGRPAAIFKINKVGLRDKASSGITIPRLQKAVS